MTTPLMVILAMLAVVGIYFGLFGNNGSAFLNNFVGSFAGNNAKAIQELFFKTVFPLLGYVARHDGPVNKQEIKRTETFMEKMGLTANQKREAIRLFKMGSAPQFDVDGTIKDFQVLAKKSPSLTQILIVYLVNLARVDGWLVHQEVDAVKKVASGLGYSDITFKHLLKMVSAQNRFTEETAANSKENQKKNRQDNSKEKTGEHSHKQQYKGFKNGSERSGCAYDALGLTPSASDAEIKKAYRTLVNQLHPDKLIGQGLPPFMIGALTERFKNIQTAYNCIKESRANIS